jgi:hypothetical protein
MGLELSKTGHPQLNVEEYACLAQPYEERRNRAEFVTPGLHLRR